MRPEIIEMFLYEAFSTHESIYRRLRTSGESIFFSCAQTTMLLCSNFVELVYQLCWFPILACGFIWLQMSAQYFVTYERI